MKTNNKYLYSILILLITFATHSCAQDELPKHGLKERLVKIAEQEHFPNLSVRIQSPKFNLLFDYKSKDNGIKDIQNYGVASTTKLMAAVLILKQIEDGKLGLDDFVSKYADANEFTKIEWFNSITIRNLLDHTSGIADYTKNPTFMELVMQGKGPKTLQEKINLIDQKLTSTPFGKHAYSNSNYILLEKVIEKISGKNAQFVFNQFYGSLSLKNIQISDEEDRNQAFYAANVNQVGNVSGWQEYYGYDGGAFANASDVESFLKKLFIEKSILSQASLDFLMQWIDVGPNIINYGFAQMNAYGLGLMQYQFGNNTWIGHAGSSLKYQCFAFFDPSCGATIVLQTNASGRHYNNAFFIALLKEITNELIN